MLTEPVGLDPVDVEQVARPAGRPLDFDLLSLVPVAAELDVRLDPEPLGCRKFRPQTDHATGRVAVQHGAGPPDDLDPAGRAQIEVGRLGRAVCGRERDAVLQQLDVSHPEPDHRRPDGGLHTARETEIPSVLDEQSRNATQRLGQGLLALRELDLVSPDDGDGGRHFAALLNGPGHRDGFRKRRDFQHDVQRQRGAHGEHNGHRPAAEPRQDRVYVIVARRQLKQLEASLGAAHRAAGDIRPEVPRRDRRAGQNRAGFVTNRALDRALAGLRKSPRCRPTDQHPDET